MKVLILLPTVFLSNAKIIQTISALIVNVGWLMTLQISAPYISSSHDSSDSLAKQSQITTILLSLIAVLVCAGASGN